MPTLYDPAYDLAHAPTDEPNWQESVVLIFRDPDSDLVGFVRLGSEPNAKTSQVHFQLATRDGLRFRRNLIDIPMGPADRTPDGFCAGSLSWTIPKLEHVHVTAKEKEAEVDLRLYDYFPSVAWRLPGHGMAETAAGHLESSGRVEGRVRLGDRVFKIENGLGTRDHSWGRRDGTSLRNLRWVAGTCGPKLSFSSVIVQLPTGDFMRGGFVVRDGVVEHAKHVHTLAHVLEDGLTTTGGYTEITLDSGECVRIEAEVIDGFITSYRSDHGGPGASPAGVEGLSIARAAGLEGFCDFNIANNPCGGQQPIAAVVKGTLIDGLSRRA